MQLGSGLDDQGLPIQWDARRHRKQRVQTHRLPVLKNRLKVFAWAQHRRWCESPRNRISYLSPILVIIGASQFVVANASQASAKVEVSVNKLPC
jgi:hypothetical protein